MKRQNQLPVYTDNSNVELCGLNIHTKRLFRSAHRGYLFVNVNPEASGRGKILAHPGSRG